MHVAAFTCFACFAFLGKVEPGIDPTKDPLRFLRDVLKFLPTRSIGRCADAVYRGSWKPFGGQSGREKVPEAWAVVEEED